MRALRRPGLRSLQEFWYTTNMKILVSLIVVLVVLLGGFFAFNSYIYTEKQADLVTDHKNATYVINGQVVTLVDGYAETTGAPGSATKVVTRYFGNELATDLNGDTVEDVAFVLTQETGGTGVFYYAVGAIKTEDGYDGTDGYLLGDRVAPQTTEVSMNPRHRYVVVFNYAERAVDEPMTTQPSVGKSAYLKVVPETMQWAVVEPNFEGESVMGGLVPGPEVEPDVSVVNSQAIVALKESTQAVGVTITPQEVISDSRCSVGVECVWAGTVEVRTTLATTVAHGEHVLTLGAPQTFGEYVVTLVEVMPIKTQEDMVDSSYRFTYEVRLGKS